MKTSAIGLSMLCCVVLLATGCGKGELVTEAEGLRDEMCECKDADCVTPVFEKIRAFDKKNAGTKVTKGDNEQILAAMAAANKCWMTATAETAPKKPAGDPKPDEPRREEPNA